MKKYSIGFTAAVFIAFTISDSLQVILPTARGAALPTVAVPWQVTSRSAHENVWESVSPVANEITGEISAERHSFTELATGLNFLDEKNGQWTASVEAWQAFPDGIVFQTGRHKVIVANDLSLAGSVDLLTPEGVRIISNPVAVGVFDPVDGRQVILAQVQSVKAELGAANEIIFRHCFGQDLRGRALGTSAP